MTGSRLQRQQQLDAGLKSDSALAIPAQLAKIVSGQVKRSLGLERCVCRRKHTVEGWRDLLRSPASLSEDTADSACAFVF